MASIKSSFNLFCCFATQISHSGSCEIDELPGLNATQIVHQQLLAHISFLSLHRNLTQADMRLMNSKDKQGIQENFQLRSDHEHDRSHSHEIVRQRQCTHFSSFVAQTSYTCRCEIDELPRYMHQSSPCERSTVWIMSSNAAMNVLYRTSRKRISLS